jgi:hypothetical protein
MWEAAHSEGVKLNKNVVPYVWDTGICYRQTKKKGSRKISVREVYVEMKESLVSKYVCLTKR